MNTDTARAGLPALIERLRDPQAYPHPVGEIVVIQTHISWVLLTGDYAYKIKKPVDLGFLDYSTLALRQAACNEELRLNRRSAPALYVDVVPVAGPVESAQVLGPGKPVEYAVRMHEFHQADQLDRLLDTGELEDLDMRWAAAHIARVHGDSPRVEQDSAYGTPKAIRHPVEQTIGKLRELLADDAARERLEPVVAWMAASFESLEATFLARRREGFVRECHGDLHLANLVRLNHEVVAFDCIEFSQELRFIDVISDVAFLMMDLLFHDRPRLAYAFINEYLESGGDYAGVAVLRYYLVYRALVRAMVALLRCQQIDPLRAEAAQASADASAHLDLAQALIAPSRPTLILMHGYSGSGKTRVSGELMRAWPALRVRSDVERKRLLGLAADESTRSGIGAQAYSSATTHATYERLRGVAATALQTGFSIIVDAANLQRWQRDRLRSLAAAFGVRFALVSCTATEAELRRRLRERAAAGGDASEADGGVLDYQLQHAEPLDAQEIQLAVQVDPQLACDSSALIARLRDQLDTDPV